MNAAEKLKQHAAEERAALLGQAEQLRRRADSLTEPDVAEQLAKDCAQTASRPKFWAELSIEEKIERCREQVKGLQGYLSSLVETCDLQRQQIRLLETALQEHRHQVDDGGRVVLPLPTSLTHAPLEKSRGGILGRGAIGGTAFAHQQANPNEVYF